jgi:hypothetical protein
VCFLVAISGIVIRAVVGDRPLGSSAAEAAAIVLIAFNTRYMSSPVCWFSFSNILHHTRLHMALTMLARMTDAKISVDGNVTKQFRAVHAALGMKQLSGASSLQAPENSDSPTRSPMNQVRSLSLDFGQQQQGVSAHADASRF